MQCGNGQAIWEQTAQWQAAQSYPELMYDQSINVFRKSHNYAFSHEWHRYQSYWFHYYLCQHYDDMTTVAQVWNQPMTGQSQGNATDFNQALMKLKNIDETGLFQPDPRLRGFFNFTTTTPPVLQRGTWKHASLIVIPISATSTIIV